MENYTIYQDIATRTNRRYLHWGGGASKDWKINFYQELYEFGCDTEYQRRL